MTVVEAVAELRRLQGQQEAIEAALEGPTQRGEALRVVLSYVEELEGRLRLACDPCAECDHIDYRELDDILDAASRVPLSQPKEPT